MDLTFDNPQRLIKLDKNEARIQEPESYINLEICDFVNTDLIMRCPACFEVPRVLLIFLCGHLECHICYSCDFKMRSLRRGRSFFTLCPLCRAEVRPEAVLTASSEIEQHPNYKISKFYNCLQVLCSNSR